MDLLIPEVGTIIWMLIAAGIVFFILVKWGFPIITRMVDERNEYIDKSLLAAKEANERLAGIQTECDELLKETRAEKARILKEATDRRDEIIAEAENRSAACVVRLRNCRSRWPRGLCLRNSLPMRTSSF